MRGMTGGSYSGSLYSGADQLLFLPWQWISNIGNATRLKRTKSKLDKLRSSNSIRFLREYKYTKSLLAKPEIDKHVFTCDMNKTYKTTK